MGTTWRNFWRSKISEYTHPFLFKLGITNLLQVYNLNLLKKAVYDIRSEAYNRIAIDYLIVACMAKSRDTLSKLPSNDPTAVTTPMLEQSELPTNSAYDQAATIVPILSQATEIAGPSSIAPTTPLMAPKDTSQPQAIKALLGKHNLV